MARLEDIIKAVVARDGRHPGGETLVVASHLQQMSLWMIRQGLRFYPAQDDRNESRRKKIEQVIDYNRLDLYLDGIVTLFLTSGAICWYLRPTGSEAYEIHWFRGGDPKDPESEYKAFYKPGGRELQQVTIRYSYEDYSTIPAGMAIGGVYDNKRWIRLKITESEIIEERFYTQPSLLPEGSSTTYQYETSPFNTQRVVNTLGFIPCAISPNHPLKPGDAGHGEFNWLRNPIEAEDAMRSSMLDNVFLMGNPSLVTTRPKNQVLEAFDGTDNVRPSWSSQQGYNSSYSMSTRREDPWVRGNRSGSDWGGRKNRVARVIGNVLPEERFGYIFPDPINGDQWRFTQEYREGIHEALGGIDPLGMKSGMTFAEVKSLYGKVAATAAKKCKSLWKYGLCKILEMVLWIEEQTFYASYRYFMLTEHPDAKKWQKQVEKGLEIKEQDILDDFMVHGLEIPPGVTGLPPYGKREIHWKHTGPVFEPAPRDMLDQSIMVRNLQELGIGSLQAMEHLFPDKDPREIKASLTGVPFRFGREVSGWIGMLLQLQQQLSSIPDPQDPSLPLAARIDLSPLINQQLLSLAKEISYGSEFVPDDTLDEPTASNSGLQYPGGNDPTSLPNTAGGVPDPSGSTASPRIPYYPADRFSGNGSGYAAGLYGNPPNPLYNSGSFASSAGSYSSPQPEWVQPIPNAGGATLNARNAAPVQPTAGLPGIPFDISTNPLLAQQLYGLQQPGTGPTDPPTAGKSRRGSKRS